MPIADVLVQLFKFVLASELEGGIAAAESPASAINLLAGLVQHGVVSVSQSTLMDMHASLVMHIATAKIMTNASSATGVSTGLSLLTSQMIRSYYRLALA